MQARQREHEELCRIHPIAKKARARFGVADRHQHLAEFGRDDGAAHGERGRQRDAGDAKQRVAGARRLNVEAEHVLEVGEAVVAAEAEIVAEEAEHQREGERLGDDRQIDAGDAAAEREPAEHEGEETGHQQHHHGRVGERVEAHQ